MNNKITFPELIAQLSEQTGHSKKVCELFLKEFFSEISQSLVSGEVVKIKGLGTFKLSDIESRKSVNVNDGSEIEIPEHKRISFIADKSLAEIINEPFEAFETVELSDEVTEEVLLSAEKYTIDEEELTKTEFISPSPIEKSVKVDFSESETPFEFVDDNVDETSSYNLEDTDYTDDNKTDSSIENIPNQEYTADENTDFNKDDALEFTNDATDDKAESLTINCRKTIKFGYGFVTGILTCIVVMLLFGVILYNNNAEFKNLITKRVETPKVDQINQKASMVKKDDVKSKFTDSLMNQDTVKIKPVEKASIANAEIPETKPSDSYVIDKITKTRYLTTMAKEHYGSYHFWPYIYEANKGLGDPDRIRPGTDIKIPALSSLGINPKNAEDIKKAKLKGVKIYARYGK